MTKFSTELKLKIVKRYLQGESVSKLAKEYGVSITILKQWVKVYRFHGKRDLRRKNQVITKSSSFPL